jgi:hypothetical protein
MEHVLKLRPCQFVLGMREVEAKVKKIKGMTPKQRKKYVNDHCVPVVKANGNLYIIDHHHFVRACWETGIKKVRIHIIADKDKIDRKKFWKFMVSNHLAYLIDQFGRGPNDPRLLPLDIRGMSDDPYRGLAWATREAGGYEKINVPFFEFQWANYLRKRVDLDEIKDNFNAALKNAVKVCRNKGASSLPGYKENNF